MVDFDPYAILGLSPSASPREIRAAYRRLAANLHPDRMPAEKKAGASEQMTQLNAARDLLLDSRERVRYHREHADDLRWKIEKQRWQTARAAYTAARRPPARSGFPLWPFAALGPIFVIFISLAFLPYLFALSQNPAAAAQFQALTRQFLAGLNNMRLLALQLGCVLAILAVAAVGLRVWSRR